MASLGGAITEPYDGPALFPISVPIMSRLMAGEQVAERRGVSAEPCGTVGERGKNCIMRVTE